MEDKRKFYNIKNIRENGLLKFTPTKTFYFCTYETAHKFQKDVFKAQENVSCALIRKLYNIHTSEWVYAVEVEYEKINE